MRTTTLAIFWAACVMADAKPGDLDRSFDPELRAWVAPHSVTVSHDGRTWIGGGFDRGDDWSTGDLVRLGENGGVESEPAQGYIMKSPQAIAIDSLGVVRNAVKPFLLENGDFLLPGASGGWLRMDTAGVVMGKAFSDRAAGEEIIPQFERDGTLWVIRKFANGQRFLERRSATNGSLQRTIEQPVNARAAVPAPGGAVWLLAGDDAPWFDFWNNTPPEQQILNLDGAGNMIGAAKVFPGNRLMRLIAGPAASFRIEFGPDPMRWMYWPSPSYSVHTIEWYSENGLFQRRKDFGVDLFSSFPWAEAPDGAFLAAMGSGNLQLFPAGSTSGITLPEHRHARSINALPNGKWLVDGLHRLNADGSDDTSWTAPELSAPAKVTAMHPMPDGRMLVMGDFALADGVVRNRLVVFLKNGTVDPSFVPDDRIGECRSVAVTQTAIYVVTEEPVAYGDAIRSNLVKLGPDGALDEGYYPQVPTTTWTLGLTKQAVDHVSRITALAGGDSLVETSSWGGDIIIGNLTRLKGNGAPNPDFRPASRHLGTTVLALAGGGYISDSLIYRANGSLERDLTKPDMQLTPLCEHLGGVLFAEAHNTGTKRLRLWMRRGWASWFKSPALDIAHGVFASSGELGTIYLNAAIEGGQPSVFRLLPNGRMDRSFRAPAFTQRERQYAGDWWTAEESGKVAFDPAKHEIATAPQTILWHPATRRLWAGGAFNMVDGQPRDGLARLAGGFLPRRWW